MNAQAIETQEARTGMRRYQRGILAAAIIALIFVFSNSAQALPYGNLYEFQDGVVNGKVADPVYNVEDTYLNGCCGAESTNYGTAQTLTTTRTGSGNRQSLYRYDLAAITPGEEVLAATFTFQASGLSGIPRDWAWSVYEIPSTNNAWTETDATFNYQLQSTTTSWKNNLGANVANGVSAILTGRHVGFLQQFFNDANPLVTIDLDPSIVQDWVDAGGTLPGFMLFAESSASTIGGNGGIRSSEYVVLSERPLLTIVTAIPPAPEPSSMLLLGCGVLGLMRHVRQSRKRSGAK